MNRVIGVGGGPEIEAITVLGSENNAGESSILGDMDPLAGVEASWVEDGGIGVAGTPFRTSESVGAKMEEESHVPHERWGAEGMGKIGRGGGRYLLSEEEKGALVAVVVVDVAVVVIIVVVVAALEMGSLILQIWTMGLTSSWLWPLWL
uniref:Uncharacterized protein n=1 Tax=Nelumbo nucifera TaxID=4432 RepID=A0A822YZ91_NELNU|nr:TPA_asm: hypothetical protein HUJ06_006706 [Nelumbo nucifera]